MTSKTRIVEGEDDRILDPSAIEAQLSSLRPDQRSNFWDLYRKSRVSLSAQQDAQRRDLIRLFKATAKDIEGDIFDVFRQMGTDNWDLRSMRRIGRDQMLFQQIKNRINALGGEFTGALEDKTIDTFKQTWVDGTYRLDALTPESSSIKTGILPDREILALMYKDFKGADFSERLGLITDDMAHNIQQQLVRSMMAEESWQDAARRIRSEMGTKGRGALWRADMIARTEIARAQEIANFQLHQENADVIEKVVWVAHPGACPLCTELNGTEIVSPEDYPPEGSHPNCVCDAVAIPKQWDDLALPHEEDMPVDPPVRSQWEEETGLSALE